MSKKILLGHTGLIGGTLKNNIEFDFLFNSKNLHQYENIVPNGYDLYLSCLPATKWLVNKDLSKDFENINNILDILKRKTYSNIFLFSTIDIYNDSPLGSDEDYKPNISKLCYGTNRYLFELLIMELLTYDNLRIFRLPAIFSKDIKKNILYDLINNNNVQNINTNSKYQWYNLNKLTNDIDYFIEKNPNEKIFNLFPEPIDTLEIVKLFPHHLKTVIHDVDKHVIYDYQTKFGNYINTKEETINEIKQLIDEFIIK